MKSKLVLVVDATHGLPCQVLIPAVAAVSLVATEPAWLGPAICCLVVAAVQVRAARSPVVLVATAVLAAAVAAVVAIPRQAIVVVAQRRFATVVA